MGAADNTPVEKVDAPALKALNLKVRLAGNPGSTPKYATSVKNAKGEDITVACPNATRALIALMDLHAVKGGAACHWGGPSAFAEINTAIHSIMFAENPWHEKFNFVNDAGHAENGIYALRANWGFDGMTFDDLKGFRSIESKLTGHGESHLNPEQVLLSNGPLGSSLPQAQGLALADKVSGNDRVTFVCMSDGASMEGEAKEAFAAIPGLAAKGKMNPFVMALSYNNTKMSGRIDEDAFSMDPSVNAFETLGWDCRRVDGHDLQAVYLALENAVADTKANPSKPVVVIAHTIKGKGIKDTEKSSSGGHGYPLKNGGQIVDFVNEIYSGSQNVPQEFASWAKQLEDEWKTKEDAKKSAPPSSNAPSVKKSKVQVGFANAMIEAAKEGYPVYSISSDVQGSSGIAPFQKTFPERFVEVGIAESNMVSVGAGYSKMGYIPVVDAFGQFGVTKGNLPLTMAALSQAPVIAVFSHIGFQDAADGASHQATSYLAATCAIPHTKVISASCAEEAQSLMGQAIKRFAEERSAGRDGESYIFFLGRENFPVTYSPGETYPWGKAQVLKEGSDVVLAATGCMVGKALQACDILEKEGVKATVINSAFINDPDTDSIAAELAKCGNKLVTVEDHQVVGGFGSLLSHALLQKGVPLKLKSLGILGEFGCSAYLADQLYDRYSLNGQGIASAAKELLS